MDWSIESLTELNRIVSFLLDSFQKDLPILKKKKFKNMVVFEGGNHLDIVDKNVGSLNLLRVEDHYVPATGF